MNKSKKKQISVHINPTLHRELKKYVIDQGITMSEWFEKQIEENLPRTVLVKYKKEKKEHIEFEVKGKKK